MRLFFVVIGFKVKRYKNRGAFKFPCHCEPQARQSPGIKYVILSASEISHRTTVILIISSLRACCGNPCFRCHCEGA